MPSKGPLRQYSLRDKRQAVIEYQVNGVVKDTAKKLNMPRTTLRQWMKTEWWDDLVTENQGYINDRVQAQLTQIIGLSHGRAIDSLTNGDEKVFYNAKLDTVHRTRVLPTGKDAIVMSGVSIDKQRLLRNQPTSIRADSDSMVKRKDQFIKLSRSYEEKRVNSIEGESEDVTEN